MEGAYIFGEPYLEDPLTYHPELIFDTSAHPLILNGGVKQTS